MQSDNFRKVVPYTPGAQPRFADMIKLNTNENPYPPAQGVIDAAARFETGMLRLYSPVDGGILKTALAEYHGVRREQVFVGVGSDDVLSVIFQACFNSGREVLFPEISYSFYEVWADLYRINSRKVPLREDFTINPDDYLVPNGGVVIANPNAPTSIALSKGDVEKIISGNRDRIVVIDEAYIDFGGESVLPLVDKYDNLIVVRTFSKSRSMAGLRIGYAISSEEIIKAIDDVKFSINSYTMNWPSVYMGVESLKDEKYFRDTIQKIVTTRERMTKELKRLGFRVLDSSANFVFASPSGRPAAEIFKLLEEKHIFVRYFNKPGIDNFLRITVGTDEQADKLIEALEAIG